MSSKAWPGSIDDQRFEGSNVCSKPEIDYMCSKCPWIEGCSKSIIMQGPIEEPER